MGLVSKTAYDRAFTCYNEGQVSMEFASYTLTKSTGEVITYPAGNAEEEESTEETEGEEATEGEATEGEEASEGDDPRRQLRRGGDSSSSEEEEEMNFPTVTMTFTQRNNFGDSPAEIEIAVVCRPWYKYSR